MSNDNFEDSRARSRGDRPPSLGRTLAAARTHPNTPNTNGGPFRVEQLQPGMVSVDGEALRIAMRDVAENYKIGQVPAAILARRNALRDQQCSAKAPNFVPTWRPAGR